MHKSIPYIKEACVESLEQALMAEKLGADRIELCSRLDLDGLTPSAGLIESVVRNVRIPIRIMIRPRGGHFVYSQQEVEHMILSIETCKTVGVEGVVFGAMTNDDYLAIDVIDRLAQCAAPLKVTVHKAIDATIDPVVEFDRLYLLNRIDAVLTSGKGATALEGIEVLQKMLARGDQYPQVIVAGKVTNENLKQLHSKIQSRAYHGKKIVGDLSV